jgi:O-antigen ligase
MASNATGAAGLALPLPLRVLLIAAAGSAFFTGTRFFGGIANNFGIFEVVATLLIVSFAAYVAKGRLRVRLHAVSAVALVMDFVCALSLAWLPPVSFGLGVVHVLILLFLTAVLIVVHNLLILKASNLPAFLLVLAVCAVGVGVWILVAGLQTSDPVTASGPFRNRAHMGLHLLTILWLVMVFAAWRGRAWHERMLAVAAIPLLLYAIAGAGRRSVFLSLFIGLLFLAVALVVFGRIRRTAVVALVLAAIGFLYWYYEVASEFSARALFFRQRVSLISSRIDMATTTRKESGPIDDNFLLLQREGAILAFSERPFFGIGWGGFLKSTYNATGHEMHPTPLRFLAETGLVGLIAYVGFVAALLFTALRTAARARATPQALPAVVLAVSSVALLFSWVYNRHIHERTFWFLAAVILAFEHYVNRWLAVFGRRSIGPGLGARHTPAGATRPGIPCQRALQGCQCAQEPLRLRAVREGAQGRQARH